MLAIAAAGLGRRRRGQPGVWGQSATDAVGADATRLFARGVELERRGDWAGAAAAFEAALERDPNMAPRLRPPRLRARPARTDRRSHRPLPPGGAPCRRQLFDAHYHLGATLWWTRDVDGALAALQRAVALDPAARRSAVLPRRRAARARRHARPRSSICATSIRRNAAIAPRPHPARRRAADAGRSRRRRGRAAPGARPRPRLGRRRQQPRPGADASRTGRRRRSRRSPPSWRVIPTTRPRATTSAPPTCTRATCAARSRSSAR